MENVYKVKLTSALDKKRRVVFDASPTIVENRNVNYQALEPIHAPGQIQVYKNTSSRNFNISDIKLISRTEKEADITLAKLWMLRSWCMPRFGNSSTLSDAEFNARNMQANLSKEEMNFRRFTLSTEEWKALNNIKNSKELLGAPPEVLYLSAYSRTLGEPQLRSTRQGKGKKTKTWEIRQHINEVPVVIQQLTIPYSNDTDYVTSSNGVPVPIIMNLDISLIETHSPKGYEEFDLDAFKNGILAGF